MPKDSSLSFGDFERYPRGPPSIIAEDTIRDARSTAQRPEDITLRSVAAVP
jgi:hypothetical protein